MAPFIQTSTIFLLFISSIFARYEAPNYRSCAANGEVDTLGTYDSFMEDCNMTNPNQHTYCSNGYAKLEQVLNYTPLGTIANFSPFISYWGWQQWMMGHGRVPMFYANTGVCPDIVHRVSELPGVQEITLEDQPGSYSIAKHGWCDSTDFVTTAGMCNDKTIWGQVPNYIASDGTVFSYNGAAFYVPASEYFASASFGYPRVMIRSFERTLDNGSTVYIPAYNDSSVFAKYEMPTLFENYDVFGIYVILVSNQNQPAETCYSGSVLKLQQTIYAQYAEQVCVVDPPCVLQVLCTQTLQPPVYIHNMAQKCQYYKELIAEYPEEASNCMCSTAFIDGATKGAAYFCPEYLKYQII